MTLPIIAEIGIQRRAKKKQPGLVLGVALVQPHWSQCMGREHVGLGIDGGCGAQFLSLVNTGLDVRLVLPE